MEYLIGIDSGGSKSELIAYDLNYKPIHAMLGGYGNPAVNLEETKFNVSTLINRCLNTLGKEDCKLIGIGMAAVESGNYVQVIENFIQYKFKIKTIILNDAHMACKAYLGKKDGILAIAGTGSSCYVQKDGKGEMVGGWSHILGDEGSGYHTVIEAFKIIIYKYDREIPFDSLSQALINKIGGASRSNIMNFIYNNKKKTIASLFPIIVNFSNNGNTEATILLENAGKYLAELTYVAYRKKNFENEITIGIKGGVFQNSCLILSTYINEIHKYLNHYQLITEDISATKGVCNLFEEIDK